jgi:hypothetical protein
VSPFASVAGRLLRRLLEEHEKPDASASVLPSIIKLPVTVLRQRICSFMVRIAGVEGQEFTMFAEEPFGGPMFDFVSAFSGMIAGGRMKSSATSSRSVASVGCDDNVDDHSE